MNRRCFEWDPEIWLYSRDHICSYIAKILWLYSQKKKVIYIFFGYMVHGYIARNPWLYSQEPYNLKIAYCTYYLYEWDDHLIKHWRFAEDFDREWFVTAAHCICGGSIAPCKRLKKSKRLYPEVYSPSPLLSLIFQYDLTTLNCSIGQADVRESTNAVYRFVNVIHWFREESYFPKDYVLN